MAATRRPGPLCVTNGEVIDEGTLIRSASPLPGPIGTTLTSLGPVMFFLPNLELTPRAKRLLAAFQSNTLGSFKVFESSTFDYEYNRLGAVIESIRVQKLGTWWTYTFVMSSDDSLRSWTKTSAVYSTFVREHQDGTQITNYHAKTSIASTDSGEGYEIATEEQIFSKNSGNFDLSSPAFLEFYRDLDALLAGLSSPSEFIFTIGMNAPKSSLTVERARTVVEDLVERGARIGSIEVTFGVVENSARIKIKADRQLS